jgi:hypothetical protein
MQQYHVARRKSSAGWFWGRAGAGAEAGGVGTVTVLWGKACEGCVKGGEDDAAASAQQVKEIVR